MKKLYIALQLELEVPDDWELVATSEGTEVIRMGEAKDAQYLDFFAEPIVTQDPEGEWESIEDEETYAAIIGKVTAEAMEMSFLSEDDELDD